MNKINEFFDWVRFSEGKEFEVSGITKWTEYGNPDNVLGSNVICVITKDSTKYSDDMTSNRYEKIYFRINMKPELLVKYVMPGIKVIPCGVHAKISGKASGNYVNYNLSCEVEGFKDGSGKKII